MRRCAYKHRNVILLYLPHTQCKSLAPEYEKLGQAFSKVKDVVIAQVDADKHKELAERFSVGGFPTLKWVSKGGSLDNLENVDTERSADALLAFVNKKTGHNKKFRAVESHVVNLTDKTFDEIAHGERGALVGFFAPWCGHVCAFFLFMSEGTHLRATVLY